MGVIVPPGHALAVWRFSLTGDPEEMITTCGCDVSGIGGAFVAAANALATAWLTQFPASTFDQDWTFKGVRLYVGQDDGSTLPFDSTTVTRTGTGNFATPVQNTAMLVQKRTLVPGRKGRGRMFWPCFNIDGANYSPAGVLTAGTLTAIGTKFNDMFVAINASPDLGPLELFHSDATPPTPLVAWVLQGTLATQRQRLRR